MSNTFYSILDLDFRHRHNSLWLSLSPSILDLVSTVHYPWNSNTYFVFAQVLDAARKHGLSTYRICNVGYWSYKFWLQFNTLIDICSIQMQNGRVERKKKQSKKQFWHKNISQRKKSRTKTNKTKQKRTFIVNLPSTDSGRKRGKQRLCCRVNDFAAIYAVAAVC